MMIRDTSLCLELPALDRPSARSSLRARLVAGIAQLQQWYAVYRQRRDLLSLDDAMLKDIGISRADAIEEGRKPFWRP